MKKALVLAIAILVLQTNVQAGDTMGKHGEAIGLSYAGVMIITGVYASTGAAVAGIVGATTAASVTKKDIDGRKTAAKLLLNDVQDYFQSGAMSVGLQAAVKALRNEDNSLSEAEALDALNDSALLLLAE